MAKSIDSQLNESLRDALVGYYMKEVIPNDTDLKNLGLNDSIKTTNDLYEYLLLDTQVSNDVQTSPVASAISSLQQYINGALLGMEPGHPAPPIDENELTAWRDQKSQYPIWAANQQLAIYPEIYIDPSLRLTKSAYFKQLEDNINQNKIHIDTTQEAVKNYLSSFEEVANLTLINGYIDSTSFDSGTYYFIGKSPAEKTYYWRTVNMAERAYVSAGATGGEKVDYPNPGAWSDWQRAELAVNDNTIERTIRPVYFNNRLFISWVDVLPLESNSKIEISPALTVGESQPEVTTTITKRVRLRLCLSYKKYDNTWSAPQTYIDYIAEGDMFGSLEKAREVIDTVASFDRNEASGSLFIALYSGLVHGDADDGSEDKYTLLRCLNIDKNFISSKSDVFPDEGNPESPLHDDSLRKTRLFALFNRKNFQFPCTTPVIAIKSVETTPANSESSTWNFNDY